MKAGSTVIVLFLLEFCSASVIQPRQTTDNDSLSDVERSELSSTGAVRPYCEKRQNSNTYEGTFWQITDIHWDQEYSDAGDPHMMCHEGYTTGRHNGIYGDYRCDAPWILVKSAIEAMAEINDVPDFILWTGDSSPHMDDPEPDFSVIYYSINKITKELRTRFQDSIPIIPVLGNRDAYPKNTYPVSGEEFYGQYLTQGGWAAVLPPEAQGEFKQGGYYGYELPTGITVLVLNTNLYNPLNKLGVDEKNPSGQFAWLRTRLQQAMDGNFKVIIAAHIPPGYRERRPSRPFFKATYNDAYVDLVNEFGEVIMAQIFGHEHSDSFRLFSAKGKTKSVAFVAPSVTPWSPVNPSLRLYTYNKSSLLDYNQYHVNLIKANVAADARVKGTARSDKSLVKIVELVKPKWELYYQAVSAYGLQSLDTDNLASLFNRLRSNDTLFQKYYIRNYGGYDKGICSSDCKKKHLCTIANVKTTDFIQCIEKQTF